MLRFYKSMANRNKPFAVDTVHSLLRTATQVNHSSLNQHPLLNAISHRECSLNVYRTAIIAYFHIFEALENRISTFIAKQNVSFDYTKRIKLSWIKEDLLYLAQDPYAKRNSPVKSLDFPEISSIGQLIGVLYTLEGSTLGGQVISKLLYQDHHLTAAFGASFFNGYGKDTKLYWDEFCQFSETILHDDHECHLAMAYAKLTFQLFEDVLNDYYQIHFG